MSSGVSERDRPVPKGLPWPAPGFIPQDKAGKPLWTHMPVVLINADHGRESQSRNRGSGGDGGDGGASYQNHTEAELVVRAAFALGSGGDIRSLALLTPYKGQVRSLYRSISVRPCFPQRCACHHVACF
jgi:hypothetical protein